MKLIIKTILQTNESNYFVRLIFGLYEYMFLSYIFNRKKLKIKIFGYKNRKKSAIGRCKDFESLTKFKKFNIHTSNTFFFL